MMKRLREYSLHFIWGTALIATIGSLFFQYVLHFPPCALCWYQRIALYPLVLIIPIGLIKNDKVLPIYTFGLSVIGLLMALYHNLLYYKIIPESLAPCIQGVSCTTQYINWLGFIDIPQLSLASFIAIFIASIIAWKGKK